MGAPLGSIDLTIFDDIVVSDCRFRQRMTTISGDDGYPIITAEKEGYGGLLIYLDRGGFSATPKPAPRKRLSSPNIAPHWLAIVC